MSEDLAQVLDSSFMITLLEASGSGKVSHHVAIAVLELLNEFFYYEEVSQVTWLIKLNLTHALQTCGLAVKMHLSYVILLSNMMQFKRNELSSAAVRVFGELCQDPPVIPLAIFENFLCNDQVGLKTEGVCFFGIYIAGLSKLPDPQLHLITVVFEWNIMQSLCEAVLTQPSCQNSSQILLVTLETIHQILKIADNFAIDKVFKHFE